MKLGIIGTGAMGRVVYDCAAADPDFETIYTIEPTEDDPWPAAKLDLIIDFSHPQAVLRIYEYCREQGGNIPVVLATTGYGEEEETIIKLLENICPVDRRTNFSQGVAAMNQLTRLGSELLGSQSDVRILEIHHTKKLDAPSGTARTLCHYAGIPPEKMADQVSSIRMGSVFGRHTVYFALEDEIVEITHTAYSKRIFALGAIEAGKAMIRGR